MGLKVCGMALACSAKLKSHWTISCYIPQQNSTMICAVNILRNMLNG